MRDIMDVLSTPSQIEKALQDGLEILGQCAIKVVAEGETVQQILEQDLHGNTLHFVTWKESLMPYPEHESLTKLKNMALQDDEGVHPHITDVAVYLDKFSFKVNDIKFEVKLIHLGQYPQVDDPDLFRVGYENVWIPNKKLNERFKQNVIL